MLNLFRFIALRHLKLRPGRTAFAVLGISCGIALWVAISIINESTLGFFKDSVTAVSGKATITISGGELGFDEKIGEAVEKVKGVTHAAPVVETRTWLLSTNESLMVLGVDLLQERAVRSYKSEGKQILGDSLTFITQPDSVILTDGFAKSHGLKMGDALELATARGKARFTIRGILSPSGLATAYGGAMAIMDIDAARLSFSKEGKTDRIDVVTAEGVDVDRTADEIRQRVGAALTVERPEMYSQEMERMIRSFQFMLHFFSSLALIVGVFLISNSVSISVAERRKEIGTLRALGNTKAGILVLFVSEALAMGSLGSLLGAFLGRGLASLMVGAVTKALSGQYTQKIEASDLKFTATTVLTSVAIGAIASVLAAFWPAFKATRIEPIEAMRRKDTGEGSQGSGFHAYSGWIGVVFLAFSTIASILITDSESRGLQMAMQLTAIIGAALLGPVIVIGAVRILKPGVTRNTGFVTRLALDNLLRNPKRTSSNVTSLMVGLTLVVIISGVNKSFKGTLVKFYGRILHADLIVSTTGKLASHLSLPLNESIKERIEKHPGVLGAYTLREVKFTYEGQKIVLKGYGEPPRPEAPLDPREKPEGRYEIFDVRDRPVEAAGHDLFHSPEPAALVSENFVIHFRKKTGDLIELETPKGPKKFRIVGVMSEYSSAVGTIATAGPVYRDFFEDHLVSGFAVKLRHGFDPIQVRAELDKDLSKELKLTIMSNTDIRNQINVVIDDSFAYTKTIEVAALLVALLGLMNTLLVSVMERTRELGLVRAVGMARGHVSAMILAEAAAQGGLGALISMALGTGLSVLWVTQNLAHSLGWVVEFHFPWVAIVTTFGLGLLVTMAAAWYPARKASGIDIVDALEYE